MNIPLIATTSVVACVSVVVTITMKRLESEMFARYSHIDKKIVRKAYRKMLLKSFTGQYDYDFDNMSDAQMDVIFLVEVQKARH